MWGEESEKDNVIDLTGTERDRIRGEMRDGDGGGCEGKAGEMLPVPVILLSSRWRREGLLPLLCHTTRQPESRLKWRGVDVKF